MIAEPQQLADQVSEAIKASAIMHHVTKREVWHPNRKKPQQMKAREWAILHLIWQGLPKSIIARAFDVSDEVVRKIARNHQKRQGSGAAGARLRINQTDEFPPSPASTC